MPFITELMLYLQQLHQLVCVVVYSIKSMYDVQYIGAPWLDPVGGAIVGYTILKAGWDICRDAMREALDVRKYVSTTNVQLSVDDKTRLKIITAVNNVKSDDFTIEELLARRSGSFMFLLFSSSYSQSYNCSYLSSSECYT